MQEECYHTLPGGRNLRLIVNVPDPAIQIERLARACHRQRIHWNPPWPEREPSQLGIRQRSRGA